MTADQLHDAIGMLPSDLLAYTDSCRMRKTAPRPRPHYRYLSMAACLGLLVCGSLLYFVMGGSPMAGSKSSQTTLNMAEDSAAYENASISGAGEITAQQHSIIPEADNPLQAPAIDRGPALSGSQMSPESAPAAAAPRANTSSSVPVLQIQNSEQTLLVSPGSYEWTLTLPDGTAQSVIACGAFPPDEADKLPLLTTSEQALPLAWDCVTLPDSLILRRWSLDGDAMPELSVPDYSLSLTSGDWIYEISASWPDGSVSYAFRAVCP